MRSMLVALVTLLAAGCTTLDLDDVWSKPDANAAQMSLDDLNCRRDVDQDPPRTPDLYVGGLADAVRIQIEQERRDRMYAKCMSARGYTRIAD